MDDVKDDAALINGAATDTVAADTSASTVDTNSSTPAGNTGSSSYETKTIPAKTHEEEIVKQVCNGCGAQFDTAREAGLHTLASDTCENYTSKVVGTVIITDVPATTQQVYIGKKCSVCGAWQ